MTAQKVFDALGGQQAIEQGGNYYRDDPVETRNFGAFLEQLAHCDGDRVLVAACGDGLETELLIEAGYDVTAFDFAPKMVEATRDRVGDRATLYVDDVAAMTPGRYTGPYAGVVFAQAAQFLQFPWVAIRNLASLAGGAFYYSNTWYSTSPFLREWVIDGVSYGTTAYYAHSVFDVIAHLRIAGILTVHMESFDAGDIPPYDYKNDYVVGVKDTSPSGRRANVEF